MSRMCLDYVFIYIYIQQIDNIICFLIQSFDFIWSMLYKAEKLRNQTSKTIQWDRIPTDPQVAIGVHTVGQMVVFDLGTRSVPGRVELTPMMSSRGVLTIKVQEIFFGRRMKHSLKTTSWKFNTAPKTRQPQKEVYSLPIIIYQGLR